MIVRIIVAVTCALMLVSCNTSDHSTSKHANKPLTDFLSLHEQYCESDYSSPAELVEALAKADGFEPLDNSIGGIFEKIVNRISYAVSSEETGCTTDLKLKNNSKMKVYFGFEELHAALLARGYKPAGEKKHTKQIGMDSNELEIIEMMYMSPRNTLTRLAYPLERQDQYFMTLFAQKFEVSASRFHGIKTDLNMHEI